VLTTPETLEARHLGSSTPGLRSSASTRRTASRSGGTTSGHRTCVSGPSASSWVTRRRSRSPPRRHRASARTSPNAFGCAPQSSSRHHLIVRTCTSRLRSCLAPEARCRGPPHSQAPPARHRVLRHDHGRRSALWRIGEGAHPRGPLPREDARH
jgi:hypothetical protein